MKPGFLKKSKMHKLLTCIFLLFLFFLNSPVSFSQLPEDFPSVNKIDLPGARFSSPRTFNGSSLFGYIDGGAELYLEYGFSVVSVIEIEYLQGKYKTEIYKMNDPEAAFGIFSVSKYRCLDMPSLSEFTCRTRYQLQICKGPYYISIINSQGTKTDSIASITIGKIITDKIPDDDLDLSKYLPGIKKETIKTNCILAKGKLGIMNGMPDLEDYFKEVENYTAVFVKSEKVIISVKFSNEMSYKKFLESNKWPDETLSIAPGVKKIAENHLMIELPD
ncbi:MAG TPA: hypothetical protein DEO60_06740 [Bacteroidales bacterium]|nr:hypothetical protein [Bacteroidales bacterium]